MGVGKSILLYSLYWAFENNFWDNFVLNLSCNLSGMLHVLLSDNQTTRNLASIAQSTGLKDILVLFFFLARPLRTRLFTPILVDIFCSSISSHPLLKIFTAKQCTLFWNIHKCSKSPYNEVFTKLFSGEKGHYSTRVEEFLSFLENQFHES